VRAGGAGPSAFEERSAAAACVERARAYLEAHLGRNVTLKELGRAAHMSPFHLQRTFRGIHGVSPREYVRARRAELLKHRLREGDTVSRATFEAGSDPRAACMRRPGRSWA
jgi:methylphosphotriester-DNA--protein-cysteine methyltransferase